jgi:transglutaminase-like putative cysteine protease
VNRYRVRHTTLYEYESPVLFSQHLARLKPRGLPFQTVAWARLEIEPPETTQHSRADYFGNICDFLEITAEHDALRVSALSEVCVAVPAAISVAGGPSWEEAVCFMGRGADVLDVVEFTYDSPLVRRHALLRSYAEPSFPPRCSIYSAVINLNQRIFQDFKYDPKATDVSTPLAQVLRTRRGVCQDFAHVVIGCLRSMGLAARYVSGYLETVPPPGRARLVGADASHAWAGVFVPNYGWLDLDPTNGVVPGSQHVTVAYGRDFSDVSPLKGVLLGGAGHRMTVSVDVEPLHWPSGPRAAAPAGGRSGAAERS